MATDTHAGSSSPVDDSLTPWLSIAVVLAGLVVLIVGVLQHDYNIQLGGGAVGLLGFAMLTAYIAKL